MRFLNKRPKIKLIQDELNTVMEVMASEIFIYLDLFIFSVILTVLLTPVLNSIALCCLVLAGSYVLFISSYLAVSSKMFRKH